MSLVSIPNTIQSGNADDPTRDMSNWTTLRDVINGQLGNVNFNSSDPLDMAKVNISYTDWTTWSPTWDTNGAGTLSSTSVSFAKYRRMGNTVEFKIDATHTIASTDAATTAIRFTLPVNTTAAAHIFFAYVKDPADDSVLNASIALHSHSSAANKVFVYRTFAGNAVSQQKAWSNGASREVWVQGFYEVA